MAKVTAGRDELGAFAPKFASLSTGGKRIWITCGFLSGTAANGSCGSQKPQQERTEERIWNM